MVCLYCNTKTSVTNSRASAKTHTTWRRRECNSCGSIVTTYEHIDYSSALRVQNKQNDLQPFSRDKLFMSVNRSLLHRKTALHDAGELTGTIIKQLLTLHSSGVVSSSVIVSTTHATLQRFDKPAAVSYQAYHQAQG